MFYNISNLFLYLNLENIVRACQYLGTEKFPNLKWKEHKFNLTNKFKKIMCVFKYLAEMLETKKMYVYAFTEYYIINYGIVTLNHLQICNTTYAIKKM